VRTSIYKRPRLPQSLTLPCKGLDMLLDHDEMLAQADSAKNLRLSVAILALVLAFMPHAAFGASSSITLAWPTPQVIMMPGVPVAVYGQVIGSTSGVTPLVAIQDSSNSQWLHDDGTWGAQAWLMASIVDTSGTWRYMLTPDRSGSFLLQAELQNTSGTVLSTAQSTFQVEGSTTSPPPNPPTSGTSITLAWPTLNVVMLPGVQVGIWGTETGSANPQVSVSIENNQTGQWLTANGSWGAQTWLNAPIVDSAGTWRYMYTPANGGSFTVVARVVDGSTTEQTSSTFAVEGSGSGALPPPPPPPSGTGTFPLTIVNGTSGRWTNTDIWVTIIGQATPGIWAYVTPDGVVHNVDSAQANAPGHLTYNGVNYAPMSFQLPASGVITMPANLQGGRLYISLASPLYLAIPQNNSGIALPDLNNPTDPNAKTYWDFYEFTYVYGQIAYGGDTTQVDSFGFPINVRVQQVSSGTDRSTGFLVSRADIWNHFSDGSEPSYKGLVNTYHILAPRTSMLFSTSSASAAMQSYINAIWQQYTSSVLSFSELGLAYTGSVQSDGALHFSYEGTSGYVIQKPAAEDVWQCGGALASGNTVELALEAELCAAFNRGVAGNTTLWWDSSEYYQNGTYNEYAAYLHSVTLDARTYAFPFDDVNDQSSVIILPNANPPDKVTLTVAW
jgi:hypothetical protein